MVVPMVAAATLAFVCWIVYMLVTPDGIEGEVERELTRIRRQIYRGWSDDRIAGHHPDFCVCQIHNLRLQTFSPANRRASAGR
jgi:hypothetical protein